MIKVLVIDDDEVDCLRFKRMLESLPGREYEVSSLLNFKSGLDAITQKLHDVYLVDHHLDNRSGLDLIDQARAAGNDQALILLTGYANHEIEQEALQHGASDFLDKTQIDEYLLDRSIRLSFERHSFEQLRLHNDRLISIGTIAASIAHQFNNFNTMAIGNLELILRKYELSVEVRNRIKHTLEAIERSSSISTTLLSFSRTNSSRESEELHNIAQDVAVLLNSDKSQCPIEVADDDTRFKTTINRSLIDQVVLNLAVNARHAVEQAHEPQIWITTGKEHDEVFLRVRDNGCGMSEEDSKHIFTPFYTTKNSHDKDDIKGTGLGLSLCERIVNSHGGRITVESAINQGTEMTVWLPIAQNEISKYQTAIGIPVIREDNPLNVLIIDDEQSICDILGNTLEDEGYQCHCCLDPHEALTLLQSQEFDLITLDFQLPHMNGIELLHEIKEQSLNKNTPVILISGWLQHEQRELLDSLGVKRIIDKPFSIDEIINAARKSVEQS